MEFEEAYWWQRWDVKCNHQNRQNWERYHRYLRSQGESSLSKREYTCNEGEVNRECDNGDSGDIQTAIREQTE